MPMTRRRRRTAADTAAVALRHAVPAHLRARLHEAFEPFMQAVLDAACGVRHVYAQDPATGQWARVMAPDTITALLNAAPDPRSTADHLFVIYTQDPDGPLLEALLAFSLGPPFDPDRVPALTRALIEAGPEPDLVAQVARLDVAFRAPWRSATTWAGRGIPCAGRAVRPRLPPTPRPASRRPARRDRRPVGRPAPCGTLAARDGRSAVE